MMSSQLGRALLSRRSLSADQQEATPDEQGSYGELMDVIDGILEQPLGEVEDRSMPNGDGDGDSEASPSEAD
jgi:hypothetical protein